MRVLFDNGTPRGVASALVDHVVEEARLHAGTRFEMANSSTRPKLLVSRYLSPLIGASDISRTSPIARSRLLYSAKPAKRLIRVRLPEIAAAVQAATPGSSIEVEIPLG
jgi:hypothetical protein